MSAQAETRLKPIQIPTLTQALQGGQSLPSIPLLDTDMNIIGLGSNVTSISKRIAFLGKRIYRRKVRGLVSERLWWGRTETVKVLHAHSTRMETEDGGKKKVALRLETVVDDSRGASHYVISQHLFVCSSSSAADSIFFSMPDAQKRKKPPTFQHYPANRGASHDFLA